MASLEIEVISPNETLAEVSGVSELIIPATWGQMDILPEHADYMTTLAQGELKYVTEGGKANTLNITGGLLTVSNNKATILVDGTIATVTSI